jgi:hypothetical protein
MFSQRQRAGRATGLPPKKRLTLFVTNVTLTASLGSAEVHHMYRVLPCFTNGLSNVGASKPGAEPSVFQFDFFENFE